MVRFASGVGALVGRLASRSQAGLGHVPEWAGGSIALLLGFHRCSIDTVLHPPSLTGPKDPRNEENDADHYRDARHHQNLAEDAYQGDRCHTVVLPSPACR